MRDFQTPGRSLVLGLNGAAATPHPLATMAAMEVLRDGGNAVDAAIAASCVLCVVEPMSAGLGGDCFALIATDGGRQVVGYNGSGRAPQALTADGLLAMGIDRIARESPHAVTVPGTVEAWERLAADHGRLPLDRLLAPAAIHAAEGFPVSPRVAFNWGRHATRLAASPTTAALFLRDGRPPSVGDVWRFPALSRTIASIRRDGAAAFYRGDAADAMAASLAALGGMHTADDFAAAKGEYVEPLHTVYRGMTVVQMPPNAPGSIPLLILDLLAGTDLSALDPVGPQRAYLEAEATRIAIETWADRVADPDWPDAVPSALLRAQALDRWQRGPRHRNITAPPPSLPTDTVCVTVADRDRTVISMVTSLFASFGSGLACARTGVLFQNRGESFVVNPGHPNGVGPGKRPRHTLIPCVGLRDGRTVLGLGVMGGHYQPQAHVRIMTNLIDYRMDLQEAIDSPRVSVLPDGGLECESGVSEGTLKALNAMGQQARRAELPLGGAQSVAVDWDRDVLSAASDPRLDGCALAW